MFTIGSHLSISRGYLSIGKTAASIGANTFQFFSRNPRGTKMRSIDYDDIQYLLSFMNQHKFGKILAHAPYTVNLCGNNADNRSFAANMIKEDLERMELLPNNLYNFHPGSHVGQGVEAGIMYISDALNDILTPEQTTVVLLETMAGKGTEIGRSFEELRAIINNVEMKNKVGICLDTCHVFDAGYDIVNDFDGVMEKFDRVIGIDYLKAVHLNDSMNPLGSHKDRHARIGEGYIGIKAFEKIINYDYLRDLPFFLETPNELSGYKSEIELLHSLRRD